MDTVFSVTLNAQELAAINQLIDAALRQAGLGALDAAAHFRAKFAAAARTGIAEGTGAN